MANHEIDPWAGWADPFGISPAGGGGDAPDRFASPIAALSGRGALRPAAENDNGAPEAVPHASSADMPLVPAPHAVAAMTMPGAERSSFSQSAATPNRFEGPSPVQTASSPIAASTTNQLDIIEMTTMANWLAEGYWATDGGGRRFFQEPGDVVTVNMVGLNADAQLLAEAALALWSDVTGLTFQVGGGPADLTFDDNQPGAFASSSFSGNRIISSTVNIATSWLVSQGNTIGSYGFQTYLHEIGHALGLGHGGPYDGQGTYGVDNNQAWDSWQTTVMSYFSQDENTYFQAGRAFVLTPQVADIIAMQQLYGPVTGIRTGDTIYGTGSNANRQVFATNTFGAPVSVTVFDNGGTDTISGTAFGGNQFITLAQGGASNLLGGVGNLMIAFGTVIENATSGNGHDTLVGNTAANVLRGNRGNDALHGDLGNDTLVGGRGNDTMRGGGDVDTALLSGLNGGGFDILSHGGEVFALDRRDRSFDRMSEVEFLSDGAQTISVALADAFDPLVYGASHNDLAGIFRTDAAGLLDHYLRYGFTEGRAAVDYSAAQYLANFADLRGAFGANGAAATLHFLQHGVTERRLAEDPLDYIASFDDLIAGYRGRSLEGLQAIGLQHYGQHGFAEGRRGGIDFSAQQYLLNNADLAAHFGSDLDAATAHFINWGFAERRMADDPLTYIASFNDLTNLFAGRSIADTIAAGRAHYRDFGAAEGRRSGIDFNVENYLANYADLRAAFANGTGGHDTTAATHHYISYGFGEGRTDTLLV